jgi:hypothetical protein
MRVPLEFKVTQVLLEFKGWMEPQEFKDSQVQLDPKAK